MAVKMLTLLEAISETLLCVCMVSNWSRHQSSSSSVSIAVRIELDVESSKVKQKATVGALAYVLTRGCFHQKELVSTPISHYNSSANALYLILR